MKDRIKNYIASQVNRWALSTQASESARLASLGPNLSLPPTELWAHILKYKPYTRQTIWTRVVDFYDYLIQSGQVQGPNQYANFRRNNAKLFKNTYQKEVLGLTYEDARALISLIRDDSTRRRAEEILSSAQRWIESGQSGDHIIGKGDKVRPNFRQPTPGPDFRKSYTTFYRELRKVGLKPHTLRKLALTRLVEKGASEYDLMAVAGWSSIATAAAYIQPKKVDRLKEMLK